MARRRLVRCPWALALITGIHQAEGVAGPARRTLPPSTGSGGTPIVPGGHRVEVVTNGIMFGGYQAIYRNPDTGIYSGATEMRKDGLAIGY